MTVKIKKFAAPSEDELYEKIATFLNFRSLEFGQFELIPSAHNGKCGGSKCYVVYPTLSNKEKEDKWGLR